MQGDNIPLAPLTEEELEKAKFIPAPTAARLTVVESVYHQLSNQPPAMLYRGEGHQFSRDLKSDEDAYERRCVATAEWTPLECGWVKRCSHLLLRNDYSSPVRQPDESDANDHTLEIMFVGGDESSMMLLVPSESMRVHPVDPKSLMIRGRVSGVRYTLCIVPE